MNAIGLMYVGAVLFLNGLILLGYISSKSAGNFNLFIGALQVLTPIYLIMTAYGDQHMIINAAGSFLFGFTYSYFSRMPGALSQAVFMMERSSLTLF